MARFATAASTRTDNTAAKDHLRLTCREFVAFKAAMSLWDFASPGTFFLT